MNGEATERNQTERRVRHGGGAAVIGGVPLSTSAGRVYRVTHQQMNAQLWFTRPTLALPSHVALLLPQCSSGLSELRQQAMMMAKWTGWRSRVGKENQVASDEVRVRMFVRGGMPR